MRTSIDSRGRIVIPKPIREELRLAPGTAVEVNLYAGRVEIEPVEDCGSAPLTTQDVRSLIERQRDERYRRVIDS